MSLDPGGSVCVQRLNLRCHCNTIMKFGILHKLKKKKTNPTKTILPYILNLFSLALGTLNLSLILLVSAPTLSCKMNHFLCLGCLLDFSAKDIQSFNLLSSGFSIQVFPKPALNYSIPYPMQYERSFFGPPQCPRPPPG